MTSAASGFYPLANATTKDLANICQALWGWSPCSQWIQGEVCTQASSGCSCSQALRLEPFFDLYRNITAYYLPDAIGSSHPALRSHDDLRNIVVLLRNNPDEPRAHLTAGYFASRETQESKNPPLSDQNRAFNLAARIITMVQPSAEYQSDGLLELGSQPALWSGDKSLATFINSAFPKREYPSLSHGNDVTSATKINLSSIMARRLKKVAKLEMIPTDDLTSHLLLDSKKGTVAIFHYTSILKESLTDGSKLSEPKPGSEDAKITANTHSNIPPQLAMETLSTIKDILFPDDQTSQSMLRSLISKAKFDPDIARIVEPPLHSCGIYEPIKYQYWGSRLLDLYDELENPTPRGFFEKWLERKSGARYAMMATLIGLFIAILLGALGLGVLVVSTEFDHFALN
ncbi:hypothetical protein B0J13DRAFT_648502 [Dactylonectria estremocensis]|uniref:Uncharacterized protein n=1 Tax=Dactylonectria estremocensis TaxID=1079267 RepID=A0A9P9IJP1_9HYPO|nr:hypothetical protein B0J13DRAFT_648502 [Dactylonectria estremocensis]